MTGTAEQAVRQFAEQLAALLESLPQSEAEKAHRTFVRHVARARDLIRDTAEEYLMSRNSDPLDARSAVAVAFGRDGAARVLIFPRSLFTPRTSDVVPTVIEDTCPFRRDASWNHPTRTTRRKAD